jgi:hypothetical protein
MKRITTQFFLFSFLLINFSVNAQHVKRQDWQWRTTVSLIDNKGNKYTANPYLWIPPTCKKIKAVMVMSTAVIEQTMVEDPDIRAVCAKHNIAIMWSSDQIYRDDVTITSQIEQILAAFARISGYDELNTIPWIPVGHSGTNPMARYITVNNTNRIAVAISHKASPYFGTVNTVPIVVTNGEFMEWDSYARDLKANITLETTHRDVINARTTNQQLVSYFFDPNTGHFDCSKPLLKNLALYLDGIFSLRFDAQGNMLPVTQDQGWVVELPVPGYSGFVPKKYNEATAIEKNRPWFPTQESAQAAYDLANISMTRTAQVAGFADAAGSYEIGWERGIMWPLPYSWNADGSSIFVNSVPYLKMPQGAYNKASSYTVGGPDYGLKFSFFNKDDIFINSGNPIDIEISSGNLKRIDNHNFEYVPRFGTASYLVVRQPGNAVFRTSVQAGQFTYTKKVDGAENIITFAAIPNQSILNLQPIQLAATSSSGLPVKYFVRNGPAHINVQNQLIIDKDSIPSRSKMPITIAVTAYQLGTISPAVKTATEITHTFVVTNGIDTSQKWFVSPTGIGNGSSWQDAGALQTVIDAAMMGDEIYLASGTYKLTKQINVNKLLTIKGGFARNETDLTLSNPEINKAIFTTPTSASVTYRMFSIAGEGFNEPTKAITIEGVTFENVILTAGNGAAIEVPGNNALNIMFRNVNIKTCSATNGGAVYMGDAASDFSLTFENCKFENNTASSSGGAVCLNNGLAPRKKFMFNNCQFLNNTVDNAVISNGVNGGAIYSKSNNDVYVTECVFKGNKSMSGDNKGNGGAIYAYQKVNYYITDCQFYNNQATAKGAAIYGNGAAAVTSNSVIIKNTSVVNNYASRTTSGRAAIESDNIDVNNIYTLENCIVSNNYNKDGVAGTTKKGTRDLWANTYSFTATTPKTVNIIKNSLVNGKYVADSNAATEFNLAAASSYADLLTVQDQNDLINGLVTRSQLIVKYGGTTALKLETEPTNIFCSNNKIYNLEIGDLITLYASTGQIKGNYRATNNTMELPQQSEMTIFKVTKLNGLTLVGKR